MSDLEHEDIKREIIKCVLVGDTGVGKTRLICAKACGQTLSLQQLLNVHTPTVWAIDRYRMSKQILERSFDRVDEVDVSVRLWDTFGDHHNDRRFAYGRSDTIVKQPYVLTDGVDYYEDKTEVTSRRNTAKLDLAAAAWDPGNRPHVEQLRYPEIRRMCPGTPIVLVGCKNDLRHLWTQPSFHKLISEKRPFGKPILASDVIYPEQGRLIAREIGSAYYETSVLTLFGIQDVFTNAIRAALNRRRQVRFWMTTFDTVKPPSLQKPYLPPRPEEPESHLKQSSYAIEINNLLTGMIEYDGSEAEPTFPDVLLTFRLPTSMSTAAVLAGSPTTRSPTVGQNQNPTPASSTEFKTISLWAHRLILASGTQFFRNLFTMAMVEAEFNTNSTLNTNNQNFESASIDDRTQLLLSQSDLLCCTQQDLNAGKSSYRSSECFQSRESFDSLPNGVVKLEIENSIEDLIDLRPSLGQKVYHVYLNPDLVTPCRGQHNNAASAGGKSDDPLTTILTPNDVLNFFKFLYTGKLPEYLERIDSWRFLVHWFGVPQLEEYLVSDKQDDEFIKDFVGNEFLSYRNDKIMELGIVHKLFCDVQFRLDKGEIIGGHRFLLSCRCEVMKAMFSDYFTEGRSRKIALPGVSTAMFLVVQQYLYADCVPESPEIKVFDYVDSMEFANRLCLDILVRMLERVAIDQLRKLLNDPQEELGATDQLLQIVTPAHLYNGHQLVAWCLHYISVNYNRVCKTSVKLLRLLNQTHQDYLARNRWPPVWYLKELDWFERSTRERGRVEDASRNNPPTNKDYCKRKRARSGCLCFSGKAVCRSNTMESQIEEDLSTSGTTNYNSNKIQPDEKFRTHRVFSPLEHRIRASDHRFCS